MFTITQQNYNIVKVNIDLLFYYKKKEKHIFLNIYIMKLKCVYQFEKNFKFLVTRIEQIIIKIKFQKDIANNNNL